MDDLQVFEKKHQAVVSSRTIAEHFEKRHDNVLRDIDDLIISLLKIEEPTNNFFKSKYIDSRGKEQREFLLNRDAFTVLAMGFSGDKALKWKMKYIQAFNKMENALREKQSAEWLQARSSGKMQRRETTDALNALRFYAIEQGSKNYEKRPDAIFINYTTLINSTACVKKEQRDNLNRRTLICLELIEEMITKTVNENLEKNTPYKEIYQLCKKKGLELRKNLDLEKSVKYLQPVINK